MSSEVRTSSRRASNTIAATPGPARGVARGPDVTGADPRRWLILAVVALAQLMVVLDNTNTRANMLGRPASWGYPWPNTESDERIRATG